MLRKVPERGLLPKGAVQLALRMIPGLFSIV